MARIATEPPVRTEQRLRMSYEEYLAYVDDSTHSEWVDGEVTIFMPPALRHQDIAFFIAILLRRFLQRNGLGRVVLAPFEMKLQAGRSYREPDIVVILNDRMDRLTQRRVEGAADVVFELISPESVARDRVEKLREYEAAGIREYWLIDTTDLRRGIEAHTLGPDGHYRAIDVDELRRVHSTAMPGFWLDQAWFTADDLPDDDDALRAIGLMSIGD